MAKAALQTRPGASRLARTAAGAQLPRPLLQHSHTAGMWRAAGPRMRSTDRCPASSPHARYHPAHLARPSATMDFDAKSVLRSVTFSSLAVFWPVLTFRAEPMTLKPPTVTMVLERAACRACQAGGLECAVRKGVRGSLCSCM